MENKNGIRFLYCGDTAVSVEFGNEINAEINNKIKSLSMDLASSPIKGIIEYIPAYRSLLINYDPGLISGESLIKKLKKRTASLKSAARDKKTVFLIPVCYDDEFALDIGNVCSHSGLSKDEIIKIHSGTDYLIYMLGFLPGFPYLGGLDERIFTPRLETPRTIIPAGKKYPSHDYGYAIHLTDYEKADSIININIIKSALSVTQVKVSAVNRRQCNGKSQSCGNLGKSRH